MNNEEHHEPTAEEEYQEHMGSPEMEYLQYLMEHPEIQNRKNKKRTHEKQIR